MDKNNGGGYGHMCAGGNCDCMHGWHGGRHHLLRMLLKLIIVMLIFWFGFHLGQVYGFIRAGYGLGMTGNNNWGMMRGNNFNGGTGVPTP